MVIHLLLYILGFFFIWLGAGLIVSSVSKFSIRLRLSPFVFSFVFLGILTSIPEFSVGLQAIADHDPDIFVGNLLGGIVVLFLVVIPLLAIWGNGISLKHEIAKDTLLATLGVIFMPSIFILDKTVAPLEGWTLIVLYFVLLFLVERKNGIFDSRNRDLLNIKAYSYKDILKIIIGIGIVFFSSNIIVEETIYFANLFHVSAFYISLLVVALGTNLPELSLAIRSVISGNKEIAMGDYVGSAAVNSLFFGLFTVLNNGEVITTNNFLITFGFIGTALGLFYFFSSTRQYISREHGFFLFSIYLLFILVELVPR